MKRVLLVLATGVCCLGNSIPIQASVFKDKWVDATMDCITYASQVNCDTTNRAGMGLPSR